MDYEKNLKYFKSTDTHYYIGLPIFILGVILFALGYIFWTYLFPYQDILGIVLTVIGAAIAFIPPSLRSSEKDIDEAVAVMTKDYEKETAETLGLTSRLAKEAKPLLVGAYTYADGTLYRRGKTDRKFRSDRYAAAALIFTKNGMCISEKRFSLTENAVEEELKEFPFSDIDGIAVETAEHLFANGEKAKTAYLSVMANGKALHTIPVTQNAALDKLCEDVDTLIRRTKK